MAVVVSVHRIFCQSVNWSLKDYCNGLSFANANDKLLQQSFQTQIGTLGEYTMDTYYYMVNPKESCLVIFPIKTGRCDRLYSIGQETFIEQSIQYTSDTTSRTTFQYFMAFIQYQNTNFAKICFSQNKTIPNSTFQQIDGTFQKKQKQYLKDRLLANATLTFIRNDHEYQLLQNITLTDCNKLIYIVIGIFSGVLILVILTVFIAVKNQ